jgi:xylose isomerase
LAFRWYDEKGGGGKTMKEHLRFASAYWHSFGGNGSDPFGEPTHLVSLGCAGDPVTQRASKDGCRL